MKRRKYAICFALIQMGYWAYYATFGGYITALLVENGISNTGLSLAVLGYQACAFAGAFLLGKACDRMQSNKMPVLILCAATQILSIALTWFSCNNQVISVIYAAIGLVFGPMISCIDAWILHMFQGEEEMYGRLRAMGPFALAVGMLIQGFMIERNGYGIMIWGGVISTSIVFTASLLIPDITGAVQRRRSSSQDLNILAHNREYIGLLLILFLIGMAVAPINNMKVSILRNLSGQVGWYGADNFFGIMMQVPVLLLSGKLRRIPLRTRYLILGILPCGMLLLDLLAMHPVMVILGTCINNIAYAVQVLTMREVTENCVASGQKNLGHTMMDAVYGCMAGMLSAVYAGAIMDYAGMRTMFAVCLMIEMLAGARVVRYYVGHSENATKQ